MRKHDPLERLQKIEEVAKTIRDGRAKGLLISKNWACRVVGINHATYSRWKRAYEEHGIEGLKPRYAQCGRKKGARK